MDIQLKRRPWYIRHKYYLLLGIAIAAITVINIIIMTGPSTHIVESDDIEYAEAKNGDFLEYIDVEGVVQPILNIKVSSGEGGYVSRVVASDGAMLEAGDTIVVLENPELLREIDELRLMWLKQQKNYRLQQYQMEQKSLTLRQQMLQAEYEISRLTKSYILDKEEAKMGIKSKAQLEVAEDEYLYNIERTRLTLESLRHDSIMNIIQRSLLDNELHESRRKYERACSRLDKLVVTTPAKGQLGYLAATPGQRVSAGERVAEVNILDNFKVQALLSEYYIDRITAGLPATVVYQEKKFPLKISKVVPEVKERTFEIELVFTGEKPENAHIGKSYRLQIELGKPEKCLTIPRDKFFNTSSGHYVYRLSESGGSAVRTPITIGRQNPKQFEVVEGLQPGDRIIISDYSEFGDVERIILK